MKFLKSNLMYEDNVLIKLRRDYGKDEVVMYALNKIQELQEQLLKADERNKALSQEVNKVRVDLKHKQVGSQEHVIRYLKETNINLSKTNNVLKTKNVDLNNKLHILLTNPAHFNKKTLEEKLKFLKNMEI